LLLVAAVIQSLSTLSVQRRGVTWWPSWQPNLTAAEWTLRRRTTAARLDSVSTGCWRGRTSRLRTSCSSKMSQFCD